MWVEVRLEVEKGSHIKWAADGRLDFLSPFPSPFNYGSVVAVDGQPVAAAEDGDPPDALVLSLDCKRGHLIKAKRLGTVRFIDEGVCDDKWICGEGLSEAQIKAIATFFTRYAVWKRRLNRLRFRSTEVRFVSIDVL